MLPNKRQEHDSRLPGSKPRKTLPYEFVLDALSSLELRTRHLFSGYAVYVGPKIVCVLRDRPTHVDDNGMWLATTEEHHESLRREFPSMRSIAVLAQGGVTGWQLLPADAPDFEESALRACELIRKHDTRIGKIPKQKRRAPKA